MAPTGSAAVAAVAAAVVVVVVAAAAVPLGYIEVCTQASKQAKQAKQAIKFCCQTPTNSFDNNASQTVQLSAVTYHHPVIDSIIQVALTQEAVSEQLAQIRIVRLIGKPQCSSVVQEC
jgi:hypothetical protein